ncbi:MAG: hypothetical protein IJW45_06455 [Oscillospiraceae bacterium]|nr:hypothetical protein [Oscillospiraceae bacterium]
MDQYIHRGNLSCLYFHDSQLAGADWDGQHLRLTFKGATVMGHNYADFKIGTRCPANPGDDRYAMPHLTLELQGCNILSILRRGYRSTDPDGNIIDTSPSHQLSPSGYADLFSKIGQKYDHVNGLSWDDQEKCYVLEFFLGLTVRFFELKFTAESILATWDHYGDEAWYVKDCRRKRNAQQACQGTKIYGAIDRKSHKFYTHLGDVFSAIKNAQLDYDWLITDVECNIPTPMEDRCNERGYDWISGSDLTKLVEQDDIQWIWAVLSGFPKGVLLEDVLKHQPLPIANGYSGFWENPISIQHPLAEVEIVPWDSSLTLVISKNEKLVSDFRTAYPKSRDLREYNTKERRDHDDPDHRNT